jgi:hypothetical protein
MIDNSLSIELPYKFDLRDYQKPFWYAMTEQGYKRAALVWHRRAGKDRVAFNFLVQEAILRKGTYFLLYPTYEQARKAVWEGIGKDQISYLDHIPQQFMKRKNNQQMIIELVNGSIIRLLGTDRFNGNVGTNPVGCIFSEYAIQDPKAWQLMRPILRENGGWAVFIYTPRGKNHGWELYNLAQENDNFFVEKLTVNDTGVLTPDDIEEERQTGMSEEMISQEFYCDFNSAMPGAIYAKYVDEAVKQGRITRIPYDPEYPVYTVWDIGVRDRTAILFFQLVGREIRIVDAYSESGVNIGEVTNILLNAKDYTYAGHYLPHDAKHRESTTGETKFDFIERKGLKHVKQVPHVERSVGIDFVAGLLRKAYIDKNACKEAIEAWRAYRREWDNYRQIYKNEPVHDWSSHYADALRYLAVLMRPNVTAGINEPYSEEELERMATSDYAADNKKYRKKMEKRLRTLQRNKMI